MMKTILVTGASGNLGKSVVTTLNDAGFSVLATLGSNREVGVFDHLAHVKTDIVNVLDENIVNQYLANNVTMPINAAILLVGGFAKGNILESDDASLEKMYRLNFISAYNFVKPLLTRFEQQGSGHFIFIGAQQVLNPAQGKDTFAYMMSKTAVYKMAEYINVYDNKLGIKATVIVPSTIDTPQNRSAMPDADFSKWVTPEYIAQKIASILSDNAVDTEGFIVKV